MHKEFDLFVAEHKMMNFENSWQSHWNALAHSE